MKARKSFEGLLNIIRFNWHLYIIAVIIIILPSILKPILTPPFQFIVLALALSIILTITISLLVSFYIYDLSCLYELKWLPSLNNKNILNINAGFDETSKILKHKFQNINLTICDFYNPTRHTEISIKRARKAYPQTIDTIQINSDSLPFKEEYFDYALAIFSVHEIRDYKERVHFLKELTQVLKPSGQIIITEHLRDFNNFMAYSIGFLHFHSRRNWLNAFEECNLAIKQEVKTTPFITTFILVKNANSF